MAGVPRIWPVTRQASLLFHVVVAIAASTSKRWDAAIVAHASSSDSPMTGSLATKPSGPV
jgi:hypothetical protein